MESIPHVKLTVGISDMKVSSEINDIIVTYSLGSCIGLSLYDPVAQVGGLVHCMLPLSQIDPARAATLPTMFTDTGSSQLIEAILKRGARTQRLIAKVAGGAKLLDNGNIFNIGERNRVVLRKVLSNNAISIANEETGGTKARSMFLYMNTGKTVLRAGGQEYEL